MQPLAFPIGLPELLIILAVVLLLFGGSRLAGLGKSTGRAIKEFKEETKGLGGEKNTDQPQPPATNPQLGATAQDPTPTPHPATDPRVEPTDADLRRDV